MGIALCPPEAASDVAARELLRVWAASGQQHVSIAADAWEDPAAWGIMLVDLLKHVARAYEANSEISYASAVQRIKQGFDAEWEEPTDTV